MRSAILLIVLFPTLALAINQRAGQVPKLQDSAGDMPAMMKGVEFDPTLKEQIPLDATLVDEKGKSVRLGEYFTDKKPVVLLLVQYKCPMLCNLVLNGATEAMRELAGKEKFTIGEQFRVVTISFDHQEKHDLAAAKKKAYAEEYTFPGAANDWHFLTGEEKTLKRICDQAGFQFKWDDKTQQFAHGAGLLVLTPEGRISRFFPGIMFSTRDLYYGLVEASQYRIGRPIQDRVALWFCYSYDRTKGTYGFNILNIVRIVGGVTCLGLITMLTLFIRRERSRRPAPVDNPTVVSV